MTLDLSAYKYQDEKQTVEALLEALNWNATHAENIKARSIEFIKRARTQQRHSLEIESFLREYGLETEEGLALMTLAEALLRIPDARTANDLIKDKINQADWTDSKSEDWLLKATSLGLNITKKTLNSLIGKLGEPIIRQAVGQAMKMMGRQFVLGRTIDEAIEEGQEFKKEGYNMSYDMLGEGARTQKDADKYFEAYKGALQTLAQKPRDLGTGLSVKLSALYPRYEFSQKDKCVPFLTEKLLELCKVAQKASLRITIDAE
ncbi:MAG: proline dehydrogenase family protein, partial [Bdellovibrionales bacterium]